MVLLHLDPTKESVLSELLSRFTPMSVVSASNAEKIKPNTVYVLPSNKSMSIQDGILYLTKPIEARGLRLPIDFFFDSLATDLKELSMGVILSGMGSDGCKGLLSIKNQKGMAFIQAPNSCKFESMPLSAIKQLTEENVDLIAPPEELAERISSMAQNQGENPLPKKVTALDIESLSKLSKILHRKTGHDFSDYKNSTLFRRIERRINLHSQNNLQEYLKFVQANPTELDLLFRELLIGVTQLFRDPPVWEYFKYNILSSLYARIPDHSTIRIWVPGCSTGEEAYTVAIACIESLDSNKKPVNFQIFATDLDEDAISIARRGFFLSHSLAELGEARRERFFFPSQDGYRIAPLIREMIIFAPQSLIRDPPFTKLDIISCRNVMIYLEALVQRKIFSLFHYCLNPGGYLLLGSAETIGERNSTFISVERKLRWYQKDDHEANFKGKDFPITLFNSKMKNSAPPIPKEKLPSNIQSLVDSLLLQKFAPASILTTELGDIVNMTGHTEKYIEALAGKAALNLFLMARPGLRDEILIGLRRVINTKQSVHLKNLRVKVDSIIHLVDVSIQKIESKDALSGLYLFVFTDAPAHIALPTKKAKAASTNKTPEIILLEAELQRTKEELQLTVEEMQTSQEELKSMNEELQSTNEEMQSTNEELTSSKEEMQSLNEELISVNNELQGKIDDYLAITNDFKNLLDSTDIATMFLDKELKIRRFTKKATTIFHLIASDIGRPFTDIVHELDYPDIENDSLSVLETLVFKEKEILSKDGKSWYSVKILPYRTIDDRIIGIVMTFSIVTKTKELELKLRKTNESLDENLKALNTLLSEKKLILKEVHHRVKNNMGTIHALLALQAEAQSDPHTREVLMDASSRVQSMMVLYSKLYQSENILSVSVKEYIPTLIAEIMDIFPGKEKVSLETHIDDIALSAKITSSLGIIINEMITNCLKYAFPNNRSGKIEIEITQRDNLVTLCLADDGVGMPSLKTNEPPRGFGLQLIEILVQQLKGTLKIEVRNGTKYTLEFEV